MTESFGRLLQRQRVAAGLSQENLAELAGVSTNAISALERGLHHAPHSATLDLLIAALRLDENAQAEIRDAAKHARVHRVQTQRYEELDEGPPNNLPPQLTSFVGRDKELPEIKSLLQSHRLVTVSGTGGVGKTRCAIHIAGEMLGNFVDGGWIADFSAISDPAMASTIIASALKVQEVANRPVLETLVAYLKRKRLLLILDNCEHVIDEVRRIIAAIVHDCATVHILVTSREPLNIAGEHAYRMPSLSQHDAEQLFCERARSVDNCFTPTAETAPHVADVCRRLDGIPLAIELAAARVKILSPKQLVRMLDERFRILAGGDRSALPRHRTMRALIDWSYDLLAEDERRLFRALSIFAGGFTLESAACVFGDGAANEIALLDLLFSLVEKSLVQAAISEGNTRYRLLESTREYAREKLKSAGEEETIARAHARAFLDLAKQLSDDWEIMPDHVWHAQTEVELENFRAALSWTLETRGDVLLGQRLVSGLRRVWSNLSAAEGSRWLRIAEQYVGTDTPDAVLAALDLADAAVASVLKQYKICLAAAERALARYSQLSDTRGVAYSEGLIGVVKFLLGDIAGGEALALRFLTAARSLDARKSSVLALEYLGAARYLAGDLDGARQRFSEALTAARAVGAERNTAMLALSLAEAEFRGGDAVAAVRLVDEALPILRRFSDARNVALAWYNMAAYLVALRRFDDAREAARDAVSAARDAQFPAGLAWALQHLAAIATLRPTDSIPLVEDRRRAARILGYVNVRLEALETVREYTEQREYDAILPALCSALGNEEVTQLMFRGSTWSEDQAIAEAMLI